VARPANSPSKTARSTMGTEFKIDPVLPKWTKAQSKSDALKKGGAFKPDIVPVIKKYDQLQNDFDKLVKEKAELPKILEELKAKFASLNPKLEKLKEQLQKVREEDGEKFVEIGTRLSGFANDPDAKTTEVQKALDDLVTTQIEYAGIMRPLSEQLVKVNDEYTAPMKKTRDEYKSKSGNLKTRWEKAQADSKAAMAQIRSVALGYEKTAAKANDTDTVKAVRSFVAEL